VHGAFADSSIWNGVVELLQAAGVSVRAVANPLRGVAADSAYVASAFGQIEGPVMAVGHAYGGAVISNAASIAGNVVGLVYVVAFAPEEGESLGEIEAGSRDSELSTALVPLRYPTGREDETAVEYAIDPDLFHEAFAGDLPPNQAAVMSITQRPAAGGAFTEPSGPVAWKTLPSWAVVATADKAAGTDVVRAMAGRAGAITVEVDASHLVMISQPQAVADLIITALGSVSPA
jgi:pimeloyl-ACP methyl ester carboxylesterase